MKFEVFNRSEERTGLIFKKPVYIASAHIVFSEDELAALAEMAKGKDWRMAELGKITYSDKMSQMATVELVYAWAKKDGKFKRGIRTDSPEFREGQIDQVQTIAENLKPILDAHFAARNVSDEDVSIEI